MHADDLRAVWVQVQKKTERMDAVAHLVLETKVARYVRGRPACITACS